MRKFKSWAGAAFFALCAAGAAAADYAPLAVGHEWQYLSRFGHRSGGLLDYESYRSRFTLTVLGREERGDTLFWRVRQRDSVYARVRHRWVQARQAWTETPLRDSLASGERRYAETGGRILRLEQEGGRTHVDSADLFFQNRAHAISAYSSSIRIVPGTRPGIKVLEHIWENSLFRDKTRTRNYWHIDGVGLYWAMDGAGIGASCEIMNAREWQLASFNRMEIDPGVDPYGGGLAKEARIACPVRPRGELKLGRVAFRNRMLNVLGRISRPGP